MVISKYRAILLALGLFAFVGLTQIILESYADARAGGGRSGGFRGSRSYSAPSRPSPSQPGQTQQRREATPAQQPSPMMPQSGGLMRGLGIAMLGGFLGSMLFSGLAHAGGFGGFGGSGFGMIEILLLAGLGYFLYRKFLSPAVAAGPGAMQYQNSQPYTQYTPASAPVQAPAANDPIDYRSLTMMDASFDPGRFLKTAQDIFFKVQGAWNKQDTAALSALCGRELMQTWEEELSQARARNQQNRMENIALRESEITEVWTENGEDFITVRLRANLLDYTVDAKTGSVINGRNSDPIEFEEYWTFSRPVGPNGWKLTAVQQA
ncbi:MAG TPA: Tim44 domain-containing protein [Candidatus Binatia bacterium]|nr:Tim44 domain-containing protein [Candidatus Binatia bacterium]